MIKILQIGMGVFVGIMMFLVFLGMALDSAKEEMIKNHRTIDVSKVFKKEFNKNMRKFGRVKGTNKVKTKRISRDIKRVCNKRECTTLKEITTIVCDNKGCRKPTKEFKKYIQRF